MMNWFRENRWLVGALVVLATTLLYLWTSPYLVSGRIQRAASNLNATTLSEYVEFDSVRRSLTEVLDLGLETRTVRRVVQDLVDRFVTPAGLEVLARSVEEMWAEEQADSGERAVLLDVIDDLSVSAVQVSTEYESFGRFLLRVRALGVLEGEQLSFVLRRRQWSWRITEVRFPASFFDRDTVVEYEEDYVTPPVVTRTSGGSVRTDLRYGLALNRNSSLERQWVTIHDAARMRVDIVGDAGIDTVYKAGGRFSSGEYEYSSKVVLEVNEPITAFRVQFLVFDVWGNSLGRSLSATEIVDLDAGETRTYDWRWNARSEHDVSELFASVAYVAEVRTADGDVLKADTQFVVEQAAFFSATITEGDLFVEED